jgi:hypothetical protein
LLLAVAGCGDLTATGEDPASHLGITPTQILATEGDLLTPQVTVLDRQGRPVEGYPTWATPVWQTSDQARLRPEGGGLRAVGPGEVRATATLGEMLATATVRINPSELGADIAGFFLVQSTQVLDGWVPLIAGRPAFLRVFLTADRPNFLTAAVRATVHHDGEPVAVLSLARSVASIPEEVEQGSLDASWNAMIPGALIRPGLSISLEVDPLEVLPLLQHSRDRFAVTGRRPFPVREVRPFQLVMVPMVTGRVLPDIHAGNLAEYTSLLLSTFPIDARDIRLREPYVVQSTASVTRVLSELLALRVADGSEAYYYGVGDVTFGAAGWGLVGAPAAIGWDDPQHRPWVVAHEIGHNMGRLHSPCGFSGPFDENYPYEHASIGVYGFDLQRRELKSPHQYLDLMGSCPGVWISDYTFRNLLSFRLNQEESRTGHGGIRESTLLVWGGVEGGKLTLEPAFELDVPARVPEEGGDYRLEGIDAAGSTYFSYAFDPAPVAHAIGSSHFAFALPARVAQPDRLARLRLVGPEGAAERTREPRATSPAPPSMTLADGGGPLRLTWNADQHPMALVRNPATGAVVSFARGGQLALPEGFTEVEVLLSDGLRSTRTQLRSR